MGGFRSHGERVNRPSFNGHRNRAFVESDHGAEGRYYVVAVAREHYEWVLGTNPLEYRLHQEGVYLPIRFRHRYRADALAKVINAFFRVYPSVDIRKDDD